MKFQSLALEALVRNNRSIFVLMSVIIIALMIDTLLVKIYPFATSFALTRWWILLFSFIVVIYAVGLNIVLKLVKRETHGARAKNKLHLPLIDNAVTVIQLGFAAILFLAIFEMIFTSSYTTLLLPIAAGASYALAIGMFGLLAAKFFDWYRANKNRIVLLYGLASSAIAANGIFTVALISSIFGGLPTQVHPHIGFYSPTLLPGSISHLLSHPYIISIVVSFILTWIATAALLPYYSKRLKKVRYWFVISIPLAFFMLQLLPLNPTLSLSLVQSNPILYNILSTTIFALSNPVGGILFGIAFWIATRHLGQKNEVKGYMIISAYGFVLFFTANQAIVLVSTPYPPFGLPTILFVGLSSYMVLAGIYCTAISLSHDSELRHNIRKQAIKKSALMESIGLAQMVTELETEVVAITKKHEDELKETTGISSSLDEDEMKRYLREVLEEVKGARQ